MPTSLFCTPGPTRGDRVLCADCGRPVAFLRFAFNYRKLRREPYFQSAEGRAVLEMLQRRYPRDPRVLNWLLREYRRGRLVVSPNWMTHVQQLMEAEQTGDQRYIDKANQRLDDPNRPDIVLWDQSRMDENGHPSPVQPGIVPSIGQMMDRGVSGHGVDIMKYTYPQFLPMYEKWRDERRQRDPNAGEVIHAYPDGWTMRRLSSPQEVYEEGEEMQNCLPKFAPDINSGKYHIFSLRDHVNAPHANILMAPRNLGGHWEGGVVRDIRAKQNAKPAMVSTDYHKKIGDWFNTFNERPSVLWDPHPEDKGPGEPEEYGLSYHPARNLYDTYPEQFLDLDEYEARYGQPQNLDPHLGGWFFEAARLDELRDPRRRADLATPEGQEFLNALERHHSHDNDILMPFLANQWKRGFVKVKKDPYGGTTLRYQPQGEVGPEHLIEGSDEARTYQDYLNYYQGRGFENAQERAWEALQRYHPHVKEGTPLDTQELNDMGGWLKSKHPTTKGLDLLNKNLTFDELRAKHNEYEDWLRKKRDKSAIIHKGPGDTYIKRLFSDDLPWEGGREQMNNCIKDYSYQSHARNGTRLLYSIRDKNGNPHVDIELEPHWWYNPKTGEKRTALEVPTEDRHGVEKAGDWQPVPQEGKIIQIQGKNNEPPHEKYHPLVKDWFNSKHFTGPEEEDWRPRWQLEQRNFATMGQLYNPGANHIIYYHPGDYGVENPEITTDYNGMVKSLMTEARQDPENKRLKHLVQWAKQFGELPQLKQALNNPDNLNSLRQGAGIRAVPENDEQYRQWTQANPEPARPAGRCPYCGGTEIQQDRYGDGYDMCQNPACYREWYVGPDRQQATPEAQATYDTWKQQEAALRTEALERLTAGAWEQSPAAQTVNDVNNMVDYHLGEQPQHVGSVGWGCFCNACGGWDFGSNDFRIAAFIKEANGFNKVRNVLKKQNQYNTKNAIALETMRHHFPEHDDLAEYLHREYRKGRLNLSDDGEMMSPALRYALEYERQVTKLADKVRQYNDYANDEQYGQADRTYYKDQAEGYKKRIDQFRRMADEQWAKLDQQLAQDPEALAKSVKLIVPGGPRDDEGREINQLTNDHLDVIKDIMKKRGQRWQNATEQEQKEWAAADKATQEKWRTLGDEYQEWERQDPNERAEWPENKAFNKLEQHNIMKTELPDLMHAARKEALARRALKLGQIIHTYPDGYTLRYIDTPEAANVESEMLGHCIRMYGNKIANGDSLNFSLRDPKGFAHTTFEIKPTKPMTIDWDRINGQMDKLNAPAQCPDCGGMLNDKGECPSCGHQSGVDPHFATYTPEQIENFKKQYEQEQTGNLDPYATNYPDFKREMKMRGFARPNWLEGNTYQIQGKSQIAPAPKYHKYIREWAESMPYDSRPKSRWSSYFTSQPIMHANDLEDFTNKVDELGFPAPNRTINWTSVANSLHPKAEPVWGSNQHFNPIPSDPNAQYDPVAGQKAYEFAAANDQLFDLYKAVKAWEKPVSTVDKDRNRVLADCPRCHNNHNQYPDRYERGMVYCGYCGDEYPVAEANFTMGTPVPKPTGPNYTPYQAAAVQHVGSLLSEHPELQTLGMHGAEQVVNLQCSHCGGGIQPCQECEPDEEGLDHGVCANCGNIAYYNHPVQARVANLIGHQRPRPHTGTYGQPCHCLWHTVNQDLWENSPHVSSVKTADKFNDYLMQRPDLQTPAAQDFLGHLQQHYLTDRTDALMPWIVREWKRGRASIPAGVQMNGLMMQEQPEEQPQPGEATGTYKVGVSPARLQHWADWYHSNHPSRQGVDIMQMTSPDMHNKIAEWDQAMEGEMGGRAGAEGQRVKHWPDGWTIQKLMDENHLKEEGEKMGHCVGGYAAPVRNGRSLIYSLRDNNNEPHATMEIHPKLSECEGKCGDYRKGDHCATCGGEVTPIPHRGDVIQIQGKANETPKPEYQQRLKEWFSSPEFHQNGEDLRPVWEDQSVDDINELEDADGYRTYHQGDYGLEEPDTDYDWAGIVNSMCDTSDKWGPSNEDFETVVHAALDHGDSGSLETALDQWHDAAYNDFESQFDNDLRRDPESTAEEHGFDKFEDSYEYQKLEPEVKCDECDGTGEIETDEEDADTTCPECGGSGQIENPDFDEDYEEAKDQYYDDLRDRIKEEAWEQDERNRFYEEFSGELRYSEARHHGKVAKRVPHRNFSTGLPCHCRFVTHFKPVIAGQQRFYHLAPRSAQESILANGIDHTLGRSGTDYDQIQSTAANYLWPSIELAQQALARHADFDHSQQWDMYEVDPEGLKLDPDPVTPQALRITQPIGPERLRIAATHTDCPTCGDPMEAGYCKRCDWGPHNVAEPMKENPTDVTRDIKGPYQARTVFPDRWSWANIPEESTPTWVEI